MPPWRPGRAQAPGQISPLEPVNMMPETAMPPHVVRVRPTGAAQPNNANLFRDMLIQRSHGTLAGQGFAQAADELRALIRSMPGMDTGKRRAFIQAMQARGIIQGEPEDATTPAPLPFRDHSNVAGPPIMPNGFARYSEARPVAKMAGFSRYNQ